MSTVVPKKAATKKVATKSSSKLKLSFHLKYKTHFGQIIYLYGNHPQLGNNEIDQAIPMVYLNDDYWVLHVSLDTIPQDKVTYHYFILNEDGTRVFDAGIGQSIHPALMQKNEMVIIDSWNFTGFKENAFYTSPFDKVLLSKSVKEVKPSIYDTKTTHVFRVKAPLLDADQTICIIGESSIIGAWDSAKAKPLNKIQGEQFFEIALDVQKSNFPFVYKYGVYNTKTNSFVSFEEGNNRVLYEPVGKGKLVLVNDGFVHLNAKTWKGTGVAIPVFSLRSKQSAGVGEFADLKLLVDWSNQVGVKLIQILPINDTTATHTWMDSYPYAAISAFALHPMYVRIEDLFSKEQQALIKPFKSTIAALNHLPEVDFEAVMKLKWEVFRLAYKENGAKVLASKDFALYFEQNKNWLVSYSKFSYLRDLHGTVDFNQWPTHEVKDDKVIHFFYFVQYQLHLQLLDATNYAHSQGVVVKGDIPIGVYRYGADAWQNKHLFHMDMQAGAPPDDFAIAGQNWGFPTYNWKEMASDGYAWWKSRFNQMKYYFDAFRIDHILGFFRIWSIPLHAVEGILGHFVPAIPVSINELNAKNIFVDHYRLTQPFINETVLFQEFGYDNELIKKEYLKHIGDGHYELLPAYKTQRQVETYFSVMPQDEWHAKMKQGLFNLISNVIMMDDEKPHHFHFRFNMEQTSSFQHLDHSVKNALKELYVDYFFKRQDSAWEKEAMEKLPMLKLSTDMLICGEDLGLVPSCVPNVM